MFLALQVLLLLVGAGLSVVNVRLGLAVWLALGTHFVSFMWMTVPSRHGVVEAAVFGSVYFAVGLALAWSRQRMSWWAVPAATLGVFALLRATMLIYWNANAPISGVSLATLGRSTWALMAAASVALITAHLLMVAVRGRGATHIGAPLEQKLP